MQRTARMAFLMDDLVLLWSAHRVGTREGADWLRRPWDPHKGAPSFRDLLIGLRREAWRNHVVDPPSPLRRPQKWPPSWRVNYTPVGTSSVIRGRRDITLVPRVRPDPTPSPLPYEGGGTDLPAPRRRGAGGEVVPPAELVPPTVNSYPGGANYYL